MAKPKIKQMKALSIVQPWADCIVQKGKNVENRPRTTHYRGTIALHSSAKPRKDDFDWLREKRRIKMNPEDSALGSIVGFAEIVDVVTKRTAKGKNKKWFEGKYGYVLKNVVKLKRPVPVKGALGFWKLKGKALNDCLKQLSKSRVSRFKPFEKAKKAA